jgi:hypothetical protein
MNTRKVVEISVAQANNALTNYHFNRMKDDGCLRHLIQRGGFPNPTYRMSGESVAAELREILKHSPSAFHEALTEAINDDVDIVGVRISPNKIYVLFDKNMPLTEEIKDENLEDIDEDDEDEWDEDEDEDDDYDDEEDMQSLLANAEWEDDEDDDEDE